MATLNQAGTTSQKGATEQYGQNNRGSAAFDSTKITPRDSGSILGTVPPGKVGIKQTSGVIQDSTDPLVSGQLANNQADNFLASTPGAQGSGNAPTVNAAQLASAGKSLAPEHE
jgi:hypothetical protein